MNYITHKYCKLYSILIAQFFLILPFTPAKAQKGKGLTAVYSGITWFDNEGHAVSAHGGCVVKDNGRYYFFGEKHTDNSNEFAGFNCYSSTDLCNWKFEKTALPVQLNGKLGPNRVGERPKVMKCPATGEYIMYMHADTLTYKDQFVGYATAKTITGPYIFRGPLLFKGQPIRRWDMGTFQDRDGSGYVLCHGGEIYRLSNDFKSVDEQVNKSFTPGFEAPTLFKRNNLYYFLGSNLTSWEKNDNYYFTATSLRGPWTSRGIFCPAGTLTWNSQTTFVLPVGGLKDTTFIFMGDRWSFPKQASAATYVWQPIQFSGDAISISIFQPFWMVDAATGIVNKSDIRRKRIENNNKQILKYSGKWQHILADTSIISSDEKGSTFSMNFTGKQIGFNGMLRPDGGYASVEIKDQNGKTVLKTVIDTYCKYRVKSLLFLSPLMAKGPYNVTVEVLKEHGKWPDKRKSDYGSIGYLISLDNVIITE